MFLENFIQSNHNWLFDFKDAKVSVCVTNEDYHKIITQIMEPRYFQRIRVQIELFITK